MKIESIRLKNFKSFRDAEYVDLPDFCIIVGANGTVKSTIFSGLRISTQCDDQQCQCSLGKIGRKPGLQRSAQQEFHRAD